MTAPLGRALSNWQVRQWATIRRLPSYTISCNLCEWDDVTPTREEAEDLYRNHWRKMHER